MRFDRWRQVAVILVAAALLVAGQVIAGDPVVAAVIVAVLVPLAWWNWPNRRGRHVSHRQAQAEVGGEGVIVYWRPGCPYCARLKLALRPVGHEVTWVNIWQDAEAASYVAGHRDGNETVPTAVTGSGELLPSTAEAIKAQLAVARS
jgi:glutaredoxin